MKFTHALRNLHRGGRIAEIMGCESLRMEEFFEPAVREATEETRTNVLSAQAAQDLKFRLTIDQIIYVDSIYA
jgi:hypothetical protein